MNQRAPQFLVTLLIAAASLLGLGGLTLVIHYESWLSTVVTIVVAVALVVVAARMRAHSRWVPTLVGAIAGLMFMVWGYALRPDASHHLLPTPGALTDLGAAIAAGLRHADQSAIPVTATPGFAALVSGSVIALFLIAEHLAVSWRLTATAGILLLLPWLPAAILQHSVSISLLVTAIACWVAAMAATRPPASISSVRHGMGALASAVTVACLAMLIAPLAVGAPGWGALPRFDAPSALEGTTRLNLALDLRNSLTAKSTKTVMVYASTGAAPDTLRLYTLTDFDGNSWERHEPSDTFVPASDGVLWPNAVDDWTGRERQRLDIQVRSLAESNLPLPSAPRTVDLGPAWRYFPTQDEVTSSGENTKDLTYSVVTDLDYHQQEALVAEQSNIDSGADSELDPGYLTIAPAIDADRIRTLARDITGNATNRYEQALALQKYLRNPLSFEYDTTVTPSGEDSISEFLDAQQGYCVQFASTMVVLARSLNIPARMAVGFLHGEATDDGTYVVRGSDAHTWPELYFADQGWVRFEPTPAVQTGTAPTYAAPSTGATAPPVSVPEGREPVQRPDITNPALEGPQPEAGSSSQNTPATSWWVMAVAVAAAVAIAMFTWWRRRAPLRPATPAERAWRLIADRLASSIGWPDTLTPLEAHAHIEEALRPKHARLNDEASAALERVTAAVSHERYGPRPANAKAELGAEPHAELLADAKLVAREVTQSLTGKTAS